MRQDLMMPDNFSAGASVLLHIVRMQLANRGAVYERVRAGSRDLIM